MCTTTNLFTINATIRHAQTQLGDEIRAFIILEGSRSFNYCHVGVSFNMQKNTDAAQLKYFKELAKVNWLADLKNFKLRAMWDILRMESWNYWQLDTEKWIYSMSLTDLEPLQMRKAHERWLSSPSPWGKGCRSEMHWTLYQCESDDYVYRRFRLIIEFLLYWKI